MRTKLLYFGSIIIALSILIGGLSFIFSGAMSAKTLDSDHTSWDRLLAESSTPPRPSASSQTPPIDVNSLPMYPGSHITDEWNDYAPGLQSIEYGIQGSVFRLREFYNEELLRQGWMNADNRAQGSSLSDPDFNRIYKYKWQDRRCILPFVLTLNLIINAEESDYASTITTLILERVPNLDKIPLYSQADKVETHYEKEMLSYPPGYDVRVTTYEVQATPADVTAYFSETLRQLGWRIGKTRPDLIDFGFTDGGVEVSYFGAGGTIRTETTDNGTTEVEVRLHGRGINAPGTKTPERHY